MSRMKTKGNEHHIKYDEHIRIHFNSRIEHDNEYYDGDKDQDRDKVIEN